MLGSLPVLRCTGPVPASRGALLCRLLSAETDRFASLEASIKAAKQKALHKRRVAELAGSAWDAHEDRKLKELRESIAASALEKARTELVDTQTLESELLRELQIERGRTTA